MARRLIRHAIRQVKGNLHGVQFSHIEDVLELPETGGKAELPGIHAIRSFDWLRLAVPDQAQRDPSGGRGHGSRPASGSRRQFHDLFGCYRPDAGGRMRVLR